MRLLVTLAIVAGLFGAYYLFWRGNSTEPLVVYCAHDSIYADSILQDFEKQSGIRVAIRYDTEATKSLGLAELLIAEKAAPRCDVFWNNELLATLDLKEKGILAPYEGEGYRRIPAAFKDPEGYWTGFAARLRVYIINTDKLAATEDAVRQAMAADLSRVVMAKPLYGTTLTQYSVLWNQLGRQRLIEWHQDCRRRGLREVDGNARVKESVSQGACDIGFTDTDDFFEARDEGKPVAMLPFKLENGATICIPNTVSIIRGTRRMAEARKLVDFLLSERTELALAAAKSRQIPLGPVAEDRLPADVRGLLPFVSTGIPLAPLGASRNECLAWLKSEYFR